MSEIINNVTLPIAAMFLGVIAVAVAIIQRIVIKGSRIELKKAWQSITLGIFGVLLIIAGVVGYFVPPRPASLSSPTTISITPSTECTPDNILNCISPPLVDVGKHINAIYASNVLIVNFTNTPDTNAVVLKFASPLDVEGFRYLEIKGTSTQSINLIVEYKVLKEGQSTIAAASNPVPFPSTPTTASIEVPISIDERSNSIDELGLNFPEKNQSSTFVVQSMRLIK